MIYFITDRKHHVNETDYLKLMSVEVGIASVLSYVMENGINELGYDLETNGLDPFYHKILLTAIGDESVQFVIDGSALAVSQLLSEINENVIWTGHNLKFDYSMTLVHHKVSLIHLYDTMIAEQRLYANLFDKDEHPFRLDSVVRRNTGFLPPSMFKDIRREFIGANPETFMFANRHIEYAASDISELFKVKRVQQTAIERYRMQRLIYEIEFPLIKCIAHAELEGLNLNVEKLKELIANNKTIKLVKEKQLDEIVKSLVALVPTSKKYLTGGKYSRNRSLPAVESTGTLFDVPPDNTVVPTKKAKKPVSSAVNYSSPTEIIKIFGRIGIPLPTKRGAYVVPIFDDQGDLRNSMEEFTTGEAALEQYNIDMPGNIAEDFINTLIEYREVTTEIAKYGETFLDKINKVTGKIHTTYRQCDAVNGRFQSGGGKSQPDRINIQNIPAKPEFREIFYSEGYAMVTADLAGAEVVIMADKANDLRLFELAMKGDIHSHMAQTGFRNIYAHRNNHVLAESFIVTKKINKDVRRACKNLTFGVVYGCHEVKAAKTINVSRAEGKIYIDTIKKEIPLTFRMVEANSQLAQQQGYLILNPRTNSRVWFSAVHKAAQSGRDLDFMEAHDIDGQARNIPISGTQADIVKEIIIVMDNYIRSNNIDANLLIQVHDELVYRCPPEIKDEFAVKLRATMTEVAGYYLNNIQMDAEVQVGDTWLK